MKKTLSLLLITVFFFVSCGKKSEPKPGNNASVNTTITVSNLAGNLWSGLTNGTGAGASFNGPTGVAVDAAGNVYVADYGNDLIRKISPTGLVTTLAGSGVAGSANGTGTSASFFGPYGIALDANANIYVGDGFSNLIRKISPTGVVTTLAGSGSQGSADGTGNLASFCLPYGIAVDPAGNVYVADEGNNMIRKVSPSGVVTTLAGNRNHGSANGVGTAASFNGPTGVAVDAAGNVYVADGGNNLIRKISPTGVVTTVAGNLNFGIDNGTGALAYFDAPLGVALDGNLNLYVADYGNDLIRKISPTGLVTTLAGSGVAGSQIGAATVASFNDPRGVAVDAVGNVYVADYGNNLIRKIVIK